MGAVEEEEEEEEEEELVTEAEGLKLRLSSKSRTGYLHVIDKGSRFRAKVGKYHNLGSFATAVEAATAVARWYLQHNGKGSEGDDEVEEAMEEASEEDELEINQDEVEIEVEDEEEIKEVAEQPVPEEQPGPLPDPPQPQQLPGQPPGQQPESPQQLEVEEQPLPQRPSVSLGVAVPGSAPGSSTGEVAVLSLGQRLVQLETRLGTDAPQGANVLQRIKTLEANMDVTATGSMPDRIAVLEAKAAEWLE